MTSCPPPLSLQEGTRPWVHGCLGFLRASLSPSLTGLEVSALVTESTAKNGDLITHNPGHGGKVAMVATLGPSLPSGATFLHKSTLSPHFAPGPLQNTITLPTTAHLLLAQGEPV